MNFQEFKNKYQKKEPEKFPHRVNPQPSSSVMVQTYHHRNHIKACLDAILGQKTTFPYEILLGEDGSDDGTREICVEYAKKYPEKIRLFLHHPENKKKVLGVTTGNFNALYNFFEARGRYIAFCEGDDLWTDRNKLQKQIKFLAHNESYSLSYHSFQEMDFLGRSFPNGGILQQYKEDMTKSQLLRLTYHPLLSTVCFRKSFNTLPEEILEVINMDSFLLSLLGNYGKAKFQSHIKPSEYRRHTSGVWSKKDEEFKFISKINTHKTLGLYYEKEKNEDLAKFFRSKAKINLKSLLAYYLKTGNFKQFFNNLYRE